MSFLAGGLPLFLVISVTATLGQQEISRLELQRVTGQLNFLNQTFADFFKVAQRQVVMMSNAPTLKSMSWERIEPYLKEENHRSREYFEKFILGKPNGHFYNTKGGNPRQGGIRTFDDKDPVSKPKTIKKRTYWQKTIQEEGVYISEPMVSYTTGARQIVISSSITDEQNNIVGMLGGGISWKEIENLVALLKHDLFKSLGKEVGFSLISKEGAFIFHWDTNKGLRYLKKENGQLQLNEIGEPMIEQMLMQNSKLPGIAKAGKSLLEGKRGQVRYKEGEEWHVLVFSPVDGTPFGLAISIPEKIVLRSLYKLYEIYIWMTGIAFVVIVIVSIWVSRRLSSRIEKLNEVAKSFKGQRIDFDSINFGKDEIGELSKTFKTMSDRIVESLADLKTNEKSLESRRDQLQAEVNDRMVDIKEALKKAEKANQAKSDFVANVSHEIRTPLNAILGLSRLLYEEHDISSQHREHLSIVLSSGEHLLVIINDLLDFSKIEEGKIELNIEEVRLHKLIEDVHSLMKPSAEDKGIALEFILDKDSDHLVLGDPVRIKQILINLLSNAIKFTERGYVRLNLVCEENKMLNFTLEDTGVGMNEEECSRIFQRFEQAASETSKNYGGTGLGLAISKKLLEQMKGWISVQSEKQKGTTFNFGFPLVIPEGKKSEGHSYQHQIDHWFKYIEGKKFKALVVDDNSFNLKVAEAVLNKLGLDVRTASSGKIALEILDEEPFDMTFMDNNMPGMDGFETTRHIKSNPKISSMPVIALTANAMSEDKEKNLSAGLDDFLTKPLHLESLIEVLFKYLRK